MDTPTHPFTCLSPTADTCGEGAVWHPEHNAIYWTDINRNLVHRYGCATRDTRTWTFHQPATALALTTDPDRLLIVLGGEILLWSPIAAHPTETLFRLPGYPRLRTNDARVSPAGSLWFGTMQNNVGAGGEDLSISQQLGRLHSLSPSGVVKDWDGPFAITNTVAWTPARDALLFGDTLANTIYRYSYDVDADSVGPRTVFTADFSRGLPDGSAMDSEGCLWNCRYGGHCVVRFSPTGEVHSILETPVANPTTCAFGGPDLRTLYLTSARSNTADPNDGGLFSIDLGFAGQRQPRFRL